MRFALPNARILVHQPSGGFQGQASDIERHAEDIVKMKRRLNEIYVKHTGQNYETIERTLDRDYFMTADEAKEFGIVDNVLSDRAALETAERQGPRQLKRGIGRHIMAIRGVKYLLNKSRIPWLSCSGEIASGRAGR